MDRASGWLERSEELRPSRVRLLPTCFGVGDGIRDRSGEALLGSGKLECKTVVGIDIVFSLLLRLRSGGLGKKGRQCRLTGLRVGFSFLRRLAL